MILEKTLRGRGKAEWEASKLDKGLLPYKPQKFPMFYSHWHSELYILQIQFNLFYFKKVAEHVNAFHLELLEIYNDRYIV